MLGWLAPTVGKMGGRTDVMEASEEKEVSCEAEEKGRSPALVCETAVGRGRGFCCWKFVGAD